MNYADLDREIMEPVGIPRTDAIVFWHALRKLAAEEVVVQEQPAEEASEASTTGAGLERPELSMFGAFAAPVDQIVMTMAQVVSNSMRQHSAYFIYAETMRGLGRGELAELFEEQGNGELKEMRYFLRRISVLQPQSVPIPVAPTPPPSSDIVAALQYLISGEQQALVLFKTLHSMLGENPMKYTVEQIMTDAQEHLDKLFQYMPAQAPVEAVKEKISRALKIAAAKRAEKQAPIPGPGDVVVGAPGSEPLSTVLGRESLLQQAQLMAENEDLAARMGQAEQAQLAAQQQIESLGAENQNLQAQAMSAGDQAHMATEQAQLASEQAAQQADAKMRLSIRIQQLRQNLADIVSQDPVQEEGVGFGEQAGPGTIATSSQQNAVAQQAAAMDPTGGMGAAPTDEAAEQQSEAANAQAEAQKQTAQAQQKTQAESAKKPQGGAPTSVTVKTSGRLVDAVSRLGSFGRKEK